MKFFKLIYFDLFSSSKESNAAPEVPVLGFISFCQANNILTLFHVLLIISKFKFDYQIHKIYIVLQIILYIINYYYFQVQKKGETILNENKYSIRKKSFLAYAYIVISVFLTGFTYYIYKEF